MKLKETSVGEIVLLTLDEEADFARYVMDLLCQPWVSGDLLYALDAIWKNRVQGWYIPADHFLTVLNGVETHSHPRPLMRANGKAYDMDASQGIDLRMYRMVISQTWREIWQAMPHFHQQCPAYSYIPAYIDENDENDERFWKEVKRIQKESECSEAQAIAYVSDYLPRPSSLPE